MPRLMQQLYRPQSLVIMLTSLCIEFISALAPGTVAYRFGSCSSIPKNNEW